MPPRPSPGEEGARKTGRGSEAEALFFALLESNRGRRAPDVEPLCTARPDLADELRALFSRYQLGNEALLELAGGDDGEAPAVGEHFGRYSVRSEIARGGMGTILEVWDDELRRVLAMKVLRGAGERSDEASPPLDYERRKSRLLNEAQILGQLEHPGIVAVHEVGRNASGELFFTMQLVQGRSLAELLTLVAEGHEVAADFRLPRAVGVVQRVCEAVAYAHDRGVVHRDLKPQNVMVGGFGEAYVMDWGLAKARGSDSEAIARLRAFRFELEGSSETGGDGPGSIRTDRRDAADDDALSPLHTHEGDVVGTPAYMSPEQAQGKVELVDERSDVYGLGAILYHLLAERPPYAAHRSSTAQEVLEVVRARAPEPLTQVSPGAPAELVAICEKAMARSRLQRYPSVQTMAEDLRAWLEGRVVGAHRTGPVAKLVKWSGRQRLAAALVLVLFLVVATSAVTLGVLYGQSEERRLAAVTAQADSLRRQTALLAQLPTARGVPSFSDEFDDGRLDRRWVIERRPGSVEEGEGKLRMTSSSSERTVFILDPYVNVLFGDFDLEVDYSLVNFTVHPIPRSERLAGLAAYRLGGAGEQVMQIARHAEYDSAATPGVEQTCRALYADRMTFVEETAPAGRFRLSRRGSSIAAYTWRDGWHLLLENACPDQALGLLFFCRDYYFDDPAVFELERLDLRSLWRPPVDALEDFEEDFSSGLLAPELRIRANAGIAAVLDDELHLEKLAGRTGIVGIELDPALDRALRGDFDVSLRFELVRFPAATEGYGALTMTIRAPDGAPFGFLEVTTESGEAAYEGRYHVASDRAPLEGSSGGLRFRRRGTNIEFLYWRDRWRKLLVRPEVHGDMDIFFQVELRSTSEESYVVAIDDLSASSSPLTGQ